MSKFLFPSTFFGNASWLSPSLRLRLYSTKTGSPLAVLSYHRSSLHALAFGRSISRRKVENEEDDEEDDTDDEEDLAVEVSSKITSGRDWLATGGKDDRISLWEVYSR